MLRKFTRRRRRPAAAASPEVLETRALLTATWTLSNSAETLYVDGTAAGEIIDVDATGATVLVDTIDTGIDPATLTKGVRVNAGDGNDTVNVFGTIKAQLNGGNGDDVLVAGDGASRLRGQAGADSYVGGAARDDIYLDADDLLVPSIAAGGGPDIARMADPGAITLDDSMSLLRVIGSPGDDFIDASAMTTKVVLVGNAGDDGLFGGAGNDTISGGDGNDGIIGNEGAADLRGGAGVDALGYIFSSAGVTVVLNGAASGGSATGDTLSGFEELFGSMFDDDLTGDAGDNYISGGDGDDQIYGLGGEDELYGDDGADILLGGDDNDMLYGGDGAARDVLNGNDGDDYLDGGLEGVRDILRGGAGIDSGVSNAGEDRLIADVEIDLG